ncbi:MAG: sigma-70 family RNA polymerase sigma factor [Armatimonadetes bacterium]|nr:sigma-70 family RNA polymerase sigma factor [Armatimonadota bacterium]
MRPAQLAASEELEDRQLLARIARRDSRAFEVLYDRYGRPVYSLAMGMLRDAGGAQEVTQEVFLSIWRQAAEFDPSRGSARSWLLALAHHKAVDAVRRGRMRAAEPLQETKTSDLDVVDEALRRVEQGRVREALVRLPAEQREAIVLAYYGGYTHQEIAGRLGIPLGTAKTRIRDGMIRLRGTLAGVKEVAP